MKESTRKNMARGLAIFIALIMVLMLGSSFML